MNTTIASISTAPGQGGIGIIRLSGDKAFDITLKIFKSHKIKTKEDIVANTINYGHIYDGDTLVDEIMCSFFKAPYSYTREDVVELNVHGGIMVSQKILRVVLKNGAILAKPGEFTKRAFLNGRIDLSQVEGIASLLSAKSEKEAEISNTLLSGKLLEIIKESKKNFLNILMHLEVNIDYPEYDNPVLTQKEILNTLETEYSKFLDFEKNFDIGKKIVDGIKLAIIGKPNAGKSSLLNYILDKERAIVTNIPGTTRDTIEEDVVIEGFPVRIIDTAGIRDSSNTVEKIGVEKSIEAAKNADIIISLFDTSRKFDDEDKNIIDLTSKYLKVSNENKAKNNENVNEYDNNKNIVFVLNKSDLKSEFGKEKIIDSLKDKINEDIEIDLFKISTITKDGIDELLDKIKKIIKIKMTTKDDDMIIIHERQKNIIKESIDLIDKTIQSVGNIPEDMLSLNIQAIVNKLNELTGENVKEEILNEIFSNFCLGK